VTKKKFNLRFVVVRGIRYLRLDDVMILLRELSSTEDTDTRRRLDEAARMLEARSALLDHDAALATTKEQP
jgi:hypothetical protein